MPCEYVPDNIEHSWDLTSSLRDIFCEQFAEKVLKIAILSDIYSIIPKSFVHGPIFSFWSINFDWDGFAPCNSVIFCSTWSPMFVDDFTYPYQGVMLSRKFSTGLWISKNTQNYGGCSSIESCKNRHFSPFEPEDFYKNIYQIHVSPPKNR